MTPKSFGLCYLHAAQFVLMYRSWTLVHAMIVSTHPSGHTSKLAHAWAEKGEEIWDSSFGYMERKRWYTGVKPTHIRTYTADAAQILIRKTGHYGLWDQELKRLDIQAELSS